MSLNSKVTVPVGSGRTGLSMARYRRPSLANMPPPEPLQGNMVSLVETAKRRAACGLRVLSPPFRGFLVKR